MIVYVCLLLLLLLLCVIVPDVVVNANSGDDDQQYVEDGWSWERIFSHATEEDPIIANGNVFPPPKNESAWDCLVLVTRNQFMHYCPANEYQRTVLHRGNPGKYRGAFMGLNNNNGRRLWLLDSPERRDINDHNDRLLELDTVTGKILQSLIIDDCIDGHDAVLAPSSSSDRNKSVFVVDTRHGHVIEIAVPASAEPFTQMSMDAGAEVSEVEGYVNIRKRHTGFTRADHINNVAVHSHLLISNLHGKGAMSQKAMAGSISMQSPTRLSALHRSMPSNFGRELNLESDGFESVQNVGTWCHGIAFWQPPNDNDHNKEIQLISLDSQSGTLVSVALTGSRKYTRKVLWEPDLDHPVLVPPEGIAKHYRNGAGVFSKGLAVQGDMAYFGVSYARAPKLRKTVPETLLVAVDLRTGDEIFVRTIRSNGLVNQILTHSYLQQKIMLPPQQSTIELTYHTRHTTTANNKQGTTDPIIAGILDKEIIDNIDDLVHVTATFVPQKNCLDENGHTKHLPLEQKALHNLSTISSIEGHLDYLVQHLCNLNVQPIQDMLLPLMERGGFTKDYQLQHNNAIVNVPIAADKFKPGCQGIILIFSSRNGDKVYHFPWLHQPQQKQEESWLSVLQTHVLDPLNIPINHVLRMYFANMPVGSNIKFHNDKNAWVQRSHRVHVPIITHDQIFFLAETIHQSVKENQVLRIKSKEGEVYEFNNGKGHAVRNTGNSSRVHLIIDWVENPIYNVDNMEQNVLQLQPKQTCLHIRGQNELQCDGDTDSNHEL